LAKLTLSARNEKQIQTPWAAGGTKLDETEAVDQANTASDNLFLF